MGKFLSLLIFKIILVLYILYLVVKIIVNIGVGNISGLTAHRKENLEGLNKSLIGKNILASGLQFKDLISGMFTPPSAQDLSFGDDSDELDEEDEEEEDK